MRFLPRQSLCCKIFSVCKANLFPFLIIPSGESFTGIQYNNYQSSDAISILVCIIFDRFFRESVAKAEHRGKGLGHKGTFMPNKPTGLSDKPFPPVPTAMFPPIMKRVSMIYNGGASMMYVWHTWAEEAAIKICRVFH